MIACKKLLSRKSVGAWRFKASPMLPSIICHYEWFSTRLWCSIYYNVLMRYDDGCGRYTLKTNPEAIQARYNLAKKPPEFHASYDIKPGQTMPVITNDKQAKPELLLMRWGLIPSWWQQDAKIAYKTFNARDDKVFSSGMWRSIYHKRALIPATGYFEWTKPEKGSDKLKQKYYFRPKDLEIFSFAGFYDIWHDGLLTYTLITTEPNKEAREIHDRMPVILSKDDEANWLDPALTKKDELEQFLRPLADNELEIIEVSNEVAKWEYDNEQRVAPLNSK